MGIGKLEFGNDEGEDRGDRLEDEGESEDRKIDKDQDHPAIAFHFTSFQQFLSFSAIEESILTLSSGSKWNQPDRPLSEIDQ